MNKVSVNYAQGFAWAFNKVIQNFRLLLGITVLISGITLFALLFCGALFNFEQNQPSLFFIQSIAFFLGVLAKLGLVRISLDIYQAGRSAISRFWSPFSVVMEVIFLELIFGLILLSTSLIAFVLSKKDESSIVWAENSIVKTLAQLKIFPTNLDLVFKNTISKSSFLILILGCLAYFIWQVYMVFSLYVFVEKKCSLFQAIKQSFKIAHNYIGQILLVLILMRVFESLHWSLVYLTAFLYPFFWAYVYKRITKPDEGPSENAPPVRSVTTPYQ